MFTMTKIVIVHLIMLLMDGIIMKINYSPFCWGPLKPLKSPLWVPGPHFENQWFIILLCIQYKVYLRLMGRRSNH